MVSNINVARNKVHFKKSCNKEVVLDTARRPLALRVHHVQLALRMILGLFLERESVSAPLRQFRKHRMSYIW